MCLKLPDPVANLPLALSKLDLESPGLLGAGVNLLLDLFKLISMRLHNSAQHSAHGMFHIVKACMYNSSMHHSHALHTLATLQLPSVQARQKAWQLSVQGPPLYEIPVASPSQPLGCYMQCNQR